jgi:AcrR family transcriptional regulator
MLHAVKEHGYPASTVRELTTLAAVSNSTFYEQFDSLEDCFLASFDSIVALEAAQIKRAFLAQSGYRNQLRAAFVTYLDIAIEHPDRTQFVVLESLRLGEAGVARRQRISEIYEELVIGASAKATERGAVSECTIRAIVGGTRGLLQRRVRSGELEELRQHIDELLDWGLSYRRIGIPSAVALAEKQPRTPQGDQPGAADELWDERPDSIRDRTRLTQRERMVRGAAMVVAENGYPKLSIPAITGAAGVSNQTFYEHFSSAQEAFLEAIDTIGLHAATRIAAAVEAPQDWVEKIVVGLARLLNFLANNPLIARLPFIEAIGAGPEGLERVWMLTDGLVALFDLNGVPAEVGAPLPELVVEAIAGGIYVVLQREVAEGRTEALLELLPELTTIALAPFGAS